MTPPEFDPTTCPDNIVVSTDSKNNTALVDWIPPIGTDNAPGNVTVTESTHGYVPNTRFLAGTHLLRYTITDQAGNKGHTCGFSITVQSKRAQTLVSVEAVQILHKTHLIGGT